ncbi:hypothetical protein P3T76_012302 [Phytophthora citrophthora]|uniref:Uncharacterized protein n=1 Tax=Phytophthora citrophthora TaxID=4793 RepID=A0AAD9G5N3_9STRA|nr:hypothetical protein P3T76_012302 [Phytophthora citrophthora]
MEEQKIFELQLGTQKDLVKNNKVWKCRCVFPRMEDDILLFLTLMGDYEDSDAYSSGHRRQQALPNNKWSPLDLPFWKKLKDALGQNGTTTSNPAQVTNDGMDLEALAVGAVILASHQGGFYGIDFETFFGRLLYELGVRAFIGRVTFPQGHTVIKNFTVPFLSPPNVAWPFEFLAFWKNTCAQFGNIRRCHNGDWMEIDTDSGVLSLDCKDRQEFTLPVLKSVLKATPSSTNIHLVVVKQLQETYFTKSEMAAEPKDAASVEKPTEGMH